LYDKYIFSKVQAMLGGQIRVIVTGSAPIDKAVMELLKVCFACPIGEGYGLTETCASTTLTFMDDPESGCVGGPLVNSKIKLCDLPELNYLSTDNPPRGEICIFSPCVMEGYFDSPDLNSEVFIDGTRWFRTGDVG
jgi:long-chain acyl-CoA synthetase